MHELSLAAELLTLIEPAAQRHGARRVASVRLELGAAACVEDDALAFAFDAVTRGSCAEGARLDIARVPGCAMRVRDIEIA